MKRVIASALFMLGLMVSTTSHAWWNDEWKFRKALAVDTTPGAGNVTEAPGRMAVLVRLHTGNFAFDGVHEQGNDLRFVAADDKTPLNYQIESFDPLLGIAVIWVDLPKVAGGQRQDFWMYYGNEQAPAASSGQQTFDPDYTAIFHFEAAGAPPKDVTAYGNNLQSAPAGIIDGVIGKAAQLNGSALQLPASQSSALSAGGNFSLSLWLRASNTAGEQLLYARRDGASSLRVGLAGGVPFFEVNGQRSAPVAALAANQWQHLAVVAGAGAITLYANGREATRLQAALPALSGATAIGGDLAAAPAAPVTDAQDVAGAAAGGFVGAIDELRISRIARPAALIQADALTQGAQSKMVDYGADEEASGIGFGVFGFIVKSVPWDAWIVIGVLIIMALHSWWVIYSKNRQVGRVIDANDAFNESFGRIGDRLDALADDPALDTRLRESSLWRLYKAAIEELRAPRAGGSINSGGVVDAATIESVRVSLDAARTRENQRLGSQLTGLSNAIAGGPYIGLLGTVIGIMLVFATAAMAGDVNITAVAPGMAAALLATAMGLVVAIPALFGYNHIVGRNKGVIADMRVFVDRFIARLSELHGHRTGS